MKKTLLACLCLIAANNMAMADNAETRLKAMMVEINVYKGSDESYFSENCPKQLDFWKKTAQQGQAIAQTLLAGCFRYGEGVPKDEIQAVAWYRKAADQGNTKAEYDLGSMYFNGQGVAKDEAQAVILFHKAAEKGNVKAKAALQQLPQ